MKTADIIICHVLPYLIAIADEESISYIESGSNVYSDDEESDSNASFG